LGAFFYSFFRDHSERAHPAHPLYMHGEPTTSIMRKFLNTRQRIQSYMYTLMHESHMTGATIGRLLFNMIRI
jgi:alpha-glucosidase (family GH31 glycosyl hydrolase)